VSDECTWYDTDAPAGDAKGEGRAGGERIARGQVELAFEAWVVLREIMSRQAEALAAEAGPGGVSPALCPRAPLAAAQAPCPLRARGARGPAAAQPRPRRAPGRRG